MKNIRLIMSIVATAIAVAISLYFIFGYRPGDLANLVNKADVEKSVEQGISRNDAVTLATKRVQEDGVMSLAERKTTVKEEPNQWHISFPISAPNMRGGEPHVIIDKASGAITEVYYTQ